MRGEWECGGCIEMSFRWVLERRWVCYADEFACLVVMLRIADLYGWRGCKLWAFMGYGLRERWFDTELKICVDWIRPNLSGQRIF